MAFPDALSRAGHRLSQTGSTLMGRGENESHGDAHASRSSMYANNESRATQRKKSRLAGGKKAIAAFVISLFAFTIQTEAAQYVQQALGYRKPFFSLYLGHSSFTLLFPLYMLFLRILKREVSLSHQFHLIALNLHWQLRTPTITLARPEADTIRRRLSSLSMRTDASQYRAEDDEELDVEDFDIDTLQRRQTKPPPLRKAWSERRYGFHVGKLLVVFGVLTLGITIPALSWYCAVPLTTMADITTIYNTYAVWALVFSIWFLGEQWERRKVFSVLLACGGVVLVAYGGAEHRRKPKEPAQSVNQLAGRALEIGTTWIEDQWRRRASETDKPPPSTSFGNAMLGDLLAFFGAVTMAAYEMAFKIVGTLPDEEAQRERYRSDSRRSLSYRHLQDEDGEEAGRTEATTLLRSGQRVPEEDDEDDGDITGAQPIEIARPTDNERTSIMKAVEREAANGRNSSPSYQTMTPPIGEVDDETASKRQPSILVASQEAARRRSESMDGNGRLHAGKEMDEWIPPPLPFGLQPIIMTSGIGFVTFFTLWIGLVRTYTSRSHQA